MFEKKKALIETSVKMLDHEKAPSFTLNSSSSSSEVSFNEILENILNKRNQVPIESDKVDLVECKSILFNILRLVSQDLDCFTTVVQAADSIIDKDWIGSNSLKSEIKLFFKELIDSSSRRVFSCDIRLLLFKRI